MIHNMSKTRFYGIWNDMIMRCYNPKKERYKNYGGRGITVEDRWRVFNNFKLDMYDGYTKGLSLERIDVNLGYFRSNCKWIPIKDQSLNKSNSIRVNYLNEVYTVTELALKFKIKPRTLYNRIESGFSIDQCVNGHAKILEKSTGERKTISNWRKETGLAKQTIINRLNKRHSVDIALLPNLEYAHYQQKLKNVESKLK